MHDFMSSRWWVNSMPKADTPAFVALVADAVERELVSFLDHEQEVWSKNDGDLTVAFDEIRGLVLGGGKRIRPAFCYLGARAVGGSLTPDVVSAGAALELLHAMALFHDDVIDGSFTRRGRTTTHVRQTERHEAAAWAGDASRFGEGVAILVGDLAFVFADKLMADMPAVVRDEWTRMRLEVNIGQYLDVVGSARRDYTTAAAERIALYKTAKYTVERPLRLGALIANPSVGDDLLGGLSAFGTALGVAFQMRDDVLGVFGDPELTGKPAGDDLRESKPTALIATALSRANDSQRQVLSRVGDPALDIETIDAIRQVIVDTESLNDAEARIAQLLDSAVRGLDGIDIDVEAREMFRALGHAVAWRNA